MSPQRQNYRENRLQFKARQAGVTINLWKVWGGARLPERTANGAHCRQDTSEEEHVARAIQPRYVPEAAAAPRQGAGRRARDPGEGSRHLADLDLEGVRRRGPSLPDAEILLPRSE